MGSIVKLSLKAHALKDSKGIRLLDEEIDTTCFKALFMAVEHMKHDCTLPFRGLGSIALPETLVK
jgi:hypothetical protein